jgi:hypothetical protein
LNRLHCFNFTNSRGKNETQDQIHLGFCVDSTLVPKGYSGERLACENSQGKSDRTGSADLDEGSPVAFQDATVAVGGRIRKGSTAFEVKIPRD